MLRPPAWGDDSRPVRAQVPVDWEVIRAITADVEVPVNGPPVPRSVRFSEESVDFDLVVAAEDLTHLIVDDSDHPAVLQRVVHPVPADAVHAAELDHGPLPVGQDAQHFAPRPLFRSSSSGARHCRCSSACPGGAGDEVRLSDRVGAGFPGRRGPGRGVEPQQRVVLAADQGVPSGLRADRDGVVALPDRPVVHTREFHAARFGEPFTGHRSAGGVDHGPREAAQVGAAAGESTGVGPSQRLHCPRDVGAVAPRVSADCI
jgi:hypothetical protein